MVAAPYTVQKLSSKVILAPKCENEVLKLSAKMKTPLQRVYNKSIYSLTQICAGVKRLA